MRFEVVRQSELDKFNLSDIVIPSRATKGSAGYDIHSPVDVILKPGESAIVPTGLKASMGNGVVMMIYPRSSMGFKYGMTLANTVGIIDSDYYGNVDNDGHIMIKVVNGGNGPLTINRGDRFAQALFTNFLLTEDDLVNSKERSGGLGSSGN